MYGSQIMTWLSKSYKHIKKICIHKYWVFKYCNLAGIPWQGITHDLSKFSPVELFESIKYYDGFKSPIEACKRDKGYSKAWLHHKAVNKHHYQYWVDNYDNGGTPIPMPYKYALEMLCDYLAAARAYTGDKFSYQKEYEWWLNAKKNDRMLMHNHTKTFITKALYYLKCLEVQGCPERVINRAFKSIGDEYFV